MFNSLIDFVKIRTLLVGSFLQSFNSAASVYVENTSELRSGKDISRDIDPLSTSRRVEAVETRDPGTGSRAGR